MSNLSSFFKHNILEPGLDSVIRHSREQKVPAQVGPLERASLIPLDMCLKEVKADGQYRKQQSCLL
jgi:hypothetical protein